MIQLYRTISKLIIALILPLTIVAKEALLQEVPETFLSQLAKKHRLDPHSITFSVIELEAQKEVSKFQAQTLRPPASVIKLATCHYALSQLGANHRFETKFIGRGRLKDGIYTGDIYLIGGMDPMLTTTRLFEFAWQLKQMGVKEVRGHFYYDDSLFEGSTQIDGLGNLDQTYNPGISALSTEFNRWRLIGQRPLPELPHIKLEAVDNQFLPRQRFRPIGGPLNEGWQYSTRQRYQNIEEIPVRYPAYYTAQHLRQLSLQLGMSLPAPTKNTYQSRRADRELLRLEGQPLVQLCESTLEYSNNLLAELILVAAAKKEKPQTSTLIEAAQTMQQWLIKNYPTAGFEQAILHNGSGLSLETRMSAQSLSRLLAQTQNQRYQDRSLVGLLSLSGQSGWVRNRFHSSELAQRLLVKTGSLDFTANISGLMMPTSGRPHVFTLFISEYPKRLELEQSQDHQQVRALLSEAQNFRQRTDEFMNDLFLHWIRTL